MKHSKASIFLMELIISIMFFSLAGAVCIQMYVKANNLRQKTTNTNESIVRLQAIAESFVAQDGDLNSVAKLIPGSWFYDDNTLVVCYDKEWNEIDSPSEAVFASILALKPLDGITDHSGTESPYLEATVCTVKFSSEASDLDNLIQGLKASDDAIWETNIILSTPLRKHVAISIN